MPRERVNKFISLPFPSFVRPREGAGRRDELLVKIRQLGVRSAFVRSVFLFSPSFVLGR